MTKNQPTKDDFSNTPRASRWRLRLAHRFENFVRTKRFFGRTTLRKFFKNIVIPAPKGLCIAPTFYGYDLMVDPIRYPNGLEYKVYYTGIYEEGTLHVMQTCLHEGDRFLDIGSNLGMMSMFAATQVGPSGQVYAFEPQPNTFKMLKQNITMNGFQNIHPHNMAVGSHPESTTIYDSLGNRGSASLLKSENSSDQSSDVDVIPLDDVIQEKKIERIKMMKIDVEGWELEVLKGAKHLLASPQAPVLCIEYSDKHPIQNGKLIDIYRLVTESNDYHVFKYDQGKEKISQLTEVKSEDQLPTHDNIFCFLPVHIEQYQNILF